MGGAKPAFRVAFWAMASALGLTLFLALSDPYSTRQSIIAANQPTPLPPVDVAVEETMLAKQTGRHSATDKRKHDTASNPDLPTESHVTPTITAMTSDLDAAIATGPVPLPPDAEPSLPTVLSTPLPTMTVSAPQFDERQSAMVTTGRRRPAMPVMSPAELRNGKGPGVFIELPPPPDMEDDGPLLTTAPDTGRIASSFSPSPVASDETPALIAERKARQQLEADVLDLRRELQLLTDDQQHHHLKAMQQDQQTLLERQQLTAARLDELTERIERQTARIELLFAQESQLPAIHSGHVRPSASNGAVTLGQPQFEQAVNGRERFSLIIESGNVSEVLERLGRWTHDGPSTEPITQVDLQLQPIPKPQFLAPPSREAVVIEGLPTAMPSNDDGRVGPSFPMLPIPGHCD